MNYAKHDILKITFYLYKSASVVYWKNSKILNCKHIHGNKATHPF